MDTLAEIYSTFQQNLHNELKESINAGIFVRCDPETDKLEVRITRYMFEYHYSQDKISELIVEGVNVKGYAKMIEKLYRGYILKHFFYKRRREETYDVERVCETTAF